MPLRSHSHVFISYRRYEDRFAVFLADKLRQANIDVWLDQQGGIEGGDDWRRSIQQGLDTCALMVPIISPAYVDSFYCRNELARADRLNKTILPVMLENVDSTDYPIELERIQYFDFRDWEKTEIFEVQIDKLIKQVLHYKQTAQPETTSSPMRSYLAWAVNEFQPPLGASWLRNPEKIFLPLKVSTDQYVQEDAFEAIESSLAGQQVALVIGGYGTGKSFLASKLFLNEAGAFQTQNSTRVPILFPLKQFYGTGEDLILTQLITHLRANGLQNLTRSQFEEMLHRGEFLCILDGFDEIPLLFIHSNPMKELQRILDHLLVGENRVLITSRPGVFDNQVAGGELDNVDVWYLQPWQDDTWQEYLRVCEQKGWKFRGGYHNFYEQVAAHQSLVELTATPLYCQMLVETSNQLTQETTLNLATLYRLYIEKYLTSVEHRSLVKDHQIKRDSLMAIAVGMLEKQRLSLSHEEIKAVLFREAQHISDNLLLAFLDTDTLVFSMLIPDNERRFSFSHKSFYEYFAASKVFYEVCQQEENARFSLLGRERLSNEIIAFLVSLFQSDDPCSFTDELNRAFQNTDIQAVLGLQFPNPILIRNFLLIQLQITGHVENVSAEEIHLGSFHLQPAAGLLCELIAVNLNRSNLIEANLKCVNLRGSTLKQARLNRCVITDSDLREVDFTGADLRGITCHAVRFNGAYFDDVLIHKRDAAQLKAALYQELATYPDEADKDWLDEALEIIDECILPDK